MLAFSGNSMPQQRKSAASPYSRRRWRVIGPRPIASAGRANALRCAIREERCQAKLTQACVRCARVSALQAFAPSLVPWMLKPSATSLLGGCADEGKHRRLHRDLVDRAVPCALHRYCSSIGNVAASTTEVTKPEEDKHWAALANKHADVETQRHLDHERAVTVYDACDIRDVAVDHKM